MNGADTCMWGVCLDMSVCEGRLDACVIEYQIKENKCITVQPVPGIEIDLSKIRCIAHPPQFQYGAAVSPADHPERKARISGIFWHFKHKTCFYYIEADGKKVSKRYFEADLVQI